MRGTRKVRLHGPGQNTISASCCCWRSSAVLSFLFCGLTSSACPTDSKRGFSFVPIRTVFLDGIETGKRRLGNAHESFSGNSMSAHRILGPGGDRPMIFGGTIRGATRIVPRQERGRGDGFLLIRPRFLDHLNSPAAKSCRAYPPGAFLLSQPPSWMTTVPGRRQCPDYRPQLPRW